MDAREAGRRWGVRRKRGVNLGQGWKWGRMLGGGVVAAGGGIVARQRQQLRAPWCCYYPMCNCDGGALGWGVAHAVAAAAARALAGRREAGQLQQRQRSWQAWRPAS
eukprot:1147818-Pelagomonas_calceolata.AAC.9